MAPAPYYFLPALAPFPCNKSRLLASGSSSSILIITLKCHNFFFFFSTSRTNLLTIYDIRESTTNSYNHIYIREKRRYGIIAETKFKYNLLYYVFRKKEKPLNYFGFSCVKGMQIITFQNVSFSTSHKKTQQSYL